MAWSYADWPSQATVQLRLDRLRLHIGEVGQAVEGRSVGASADGKSIAREGLGQYLAMLLEQERRLDGAASRAAAGGRSHIRFTRP